jgi:hypothetical protein
LENDQGETDYSGNSLSARATKYFLHGIAFSLLLLVLEIVWVFMLVFLVIIGFIVGLIIGFIILFFIIGGLNAVLTQSIWKTYIKKDWKNLLAHGIVLFVVLILAGIPSLLVYYAYPNLIAGVVLFFIYCFIDGYVAKHVGSAFEEQRYEDETIEETDKWSPIRV